MTTYRESKGYMSFKKVAKWIKSKGRGKLRNYCTMCSRQFRDKKGLKNHMGAKQHLEKMKQFNENPDFYLKKFSDDFQKGFLDILIRMYGDKKVFARNVYTEYCHILHHRHLNSTYWNTLEEFVEHLGKEGICNIEMGPKGYYVEYQGAINPQNKYITKIEENSDDELDETQKREKKLLREMKRMKRYQEKERRQMEKMGNPKSNEEKEESPYIKVFFKEEEQKNLSNVFGNKRKRDDKKKQKETKKRQKKVHVWIDVGIIVKVLHKTLEDGIYYKKKGEIEKVYGEIARVSMSDSKDVIELHQKFLETVIPNYGGWVKILNGKHTGRVGKLKSINVKEYTGKIMIDENTIIDLPYENFSKLSFKNK